MEAAAALVSFVGLAVPVAQGLKSLYDLTTNMKDCPKDIREMKTDLELVEALITHVIQQCNERDVRLGESAELARAIGQAQESVEELKREMAAYHVIGKRKRLGFAFKISQTQKLRKSLDRTKAIMLDFKNQLQSDLLYDIRDMNQEVLKTVKQTNRNLETHGGNVHRVMGKSEAQAEATEDLRDGEPFAPSASDDSFEGLTDIGIVAKKLEHITELLTETKISSSTTSSPSTPGLSCESSDISVMNASQKITASSLLSLQSIAPSELRNTQQANIASQYPLLKFRDNQFQFLIATIFTQRAENKHQLACQRASECLAAYPTPELLSKALPEALGQYFGGIGLQNQKPRYLISLAQAYIRDPPKKGRLRSKANCPRSEISHLPQIGPKAINSWLVYCCGRTDIDTLDKTLLGYIDQLKIEAGTN
ncbi:hypothetical protein AA0118_g9244 [Alternaria tenuissima]|nr:hypothetical protein AA0118_g9244 [Alternaria tenuissima]